MAEWSIFSGKQVVGSCGQGVSDMQPLQYSLIYGHQNLKGLPDHGPMVLDLWPVELRQLVGLSTAPELWQQGSGGN